MLVFTSGNPALRDSLYRDAQTIVRQTGWYPIPQGSRLGSVAKVETLTARFRRAGPPPLTASRIRSLRNLGGDERGCAIRLCLDTSSVLLDSGFPGRVKLEAGDAAVLLTHDHLDHAGSPFVDRKDGATYMSVGTLAALLAKRPGLQARLRQHVHLVDADKAFPLSEVITCRPFSVPHCPGAVGYEVSDGIRSIFYTGDISVRSSRHDFIPDLCALVERSLSPERVLLLDATMAGRGAAASDSDTAAEVWEATDVRDIVVTSSATDHLVYAYVDLFNFTNRDHRSSTEFVVDATMRGTFQLLHSSYITRDHRILDPFIIAQYGKTMSSWGESRWLFWTDEVFSDWASPQRRIWFVPHEVLGDVLRRGALAVVNVGREPLKHLPWTDAELLNIDTSPWTLHSDEAGIVQAISELSGRARVVLFHNYPGRLRKFITKFGLRAEALSDEPIGF
ncbi:MAG: MBL fold metallo-hydrolase [Candidatus Dormibacteria bacterium]